MNIRQVTLKIKGGDAKTRSAGRLNRPNYSQQPSKPVLNRCIAAHHPKSDCSSAHHGYSTKVMDDLNDGINKILHIRTTYLTVAVTELSTPVNAWLDVASFTAMM